jgi:hypothetical protein
VALFIIAQNLGDHISRSIASFRRDHAMDLDRRDACLLTLAAAGVTVFDPAIAQQPVGFDPVAFAKLRAGEIAREIANSPRDVSVPEPARDTVFMTGLLLQAGLRAFLPVSQRQGVALPGAPVRTDPPNLVEAQENFRIVFESGKEATAAQKLTALKAIDLAQQQLEQQGYKSLAAAIANWTKVQRAAL